MTLVAPVPAWMFDTCHVVGGKYSLPSSHRVAASSAIAGAARWIGIARQMRVRDMTLDAAHDERARQRAAAPVLDHVAQPIDRRGLADDAVVEQLAGSSQLLDDLHRPIGGRTFFIGSDQERDRAAEDRGVRRADARWRRRKQPATISCRLRRVRRDNPSRSVGTNGSEFHASSGPVGTTSVCPAKHTTGRALPRRAHRLVTPLDAIVSQRKPSGSSRARRISWQPPSSGVGDRHAMSSRREIQRRRLRADWRERGTASVHW